PEMDGLEATRLIKQELPRTSVIIVTIHKNPDYLLQAIKAGAADYILKDATQRELISSVRKVLGGETLLSSELAAPLLRKLAAEDKGNPGPLPTAPLRQRSSPPLESLTPREVDVLRLLAQGCTNQQIARKLTIGEGTVKVHVHHLIRKLEVSDRTQAAVRGIRLGIINPG
ncbi:MAG: response regulator transcription factor, partial [Actinobacteria bacterium]|nr:response regulator transcription factor [Actinomycetota bacterium]